jgi:protoheme IX farnesyltransferase
MLVGIACVMASGCVINNYIDRGIDVNMERTKNRATVTGVISPRNTIIFATVLGIVGTFLLAFFTNSLTTAIALLGGIVYVAVYSPLKHRSAHAALAGSVSGAVPPVVGYCAVTNSFDVGAFILFIIMVLWQMPHFYAIAIYRLNDYKAASVPVFPAQKGIFLTKIHILLYINAFITAALMLTLYGFTGYVYAVVVLILGISWLWIVLQGFRKNTDDTLWSKKVFKFSQIVLAVLFVVMSIESVLITAR